MAPPKVNFAADGLRWESLLNTEVQELALPAEDDFQVHHRRTPVQSTAVLECWMAEACEFGRKTNVPWVRMDCVWTGRDKPAQVPAFSTADRAVVLPLHAVGQPPFTAWSRMLLVPGVQKACSARKAMLSALEKVGLECLSAFNVSCISWRDNRVPSNNISLTDVLYHVRGAVLPQRWDLRRLSWDKELTDD